MQKLLVLISALLLTTPAMAQVHVNGYTRSNGTYVQPYERSAPNYTVQDNYSFRGNSNPYTGSVGTNTYVHDTTSPYFNGTSDSQGQYGHANGNLYGN